MWKNNRSNNQDTLESEARFTLHPTFSFFLHKRVVPNFIGQYCTYFELVSLNSSSNLCQIKSINRRPPNCIGITQSTPVIHMWVNFFKPVYLRKNEKNTYFYFSLFIIELHQSFSFGTDVFGSNLQFDGEVIDLEGNQENINNVNIYTEGMFDMQAGDSATHVFEVCCYIYKLITVLINSEFKLFMVLFLKMTEMILGTCLIYFNYLLIWFPNQS